MEQVYYNIGVDDGSRVSLQCFEKLEQVGHLTPEKAVPAHCHDYFELVMILRGSCRHVYQGMETPLIPGDFFLVPPHRPHAYRFREDVFHCNCQFYADALGADWEALVSGIQYDRLQQRAGDEKGVREADINRQGIIHLDPTQTSRVQELLFQILKEQNEKHFGVVCMKQSLLRMLLVEVNRVQERQFANVDKYDSWKQRMIADVLKAIDQDPAADWDFKAVARKQNISHSYFRMIFKDLTGLPPREYVNRLRVVRAVDLLQTRRISISEAAEQVGIYDSNYFSRLCRKMMGYPPKYFQK